MIDGCEPWTVFDSKIRKARKPWQCEECNREITVGEEYEHARGMLDDHWSQYKTCLHCIAARSWLMVVCSGFMYSMVRDELEEHFGENPDYATMWLGRAIINMRRKWRRPDGTLVPIPEPFVETQLPKDMRR